MGKIPANESTTGCLAPCSSHLGVFLTLSALPAIALLACVASPRAQAQDVAEFYRGKTINIVLGVEPGGSYDNNARIVSRVLGRYIPGNPNVIVKYLGTANSIPAANYVYNAGPKDGTSVWAGTRLAPFVPFFGDPNARYDISKLRWLGSTASEVGVVVAWHTAPHQTADDLFRYDLIAGATVPTGDTYVYPNALNKLIGTRFKLIAGYPSQEPIALAMERGEVQGSGNWSWSNIPANHPEWLSQKKARVLMQLGLEKHPDLPDVPLVMDYAKTAEQREVLTILMGMKKFGYPFFIPPGVPVDRSDALDQAFRRMLGDPDFIAESRAQSRGTGMATGAEMTEVVSRAYALPASVVKRARDVISVN